MRIVMPERSPVCYGELAERAAVENDRLRRRVSDLEGELLKVICSWVLGTLTRPMAEEIIERFGLDGPS